MNFLPSKRIIILGLLLLVVIVGITLIVKGTTSKKEGVSETAGLKVGVATSTDKFKQAVINDLTAGKKYVEYDPSQLGREVTAKELTILTKESADAIKEYALTVAAILKPYETPRENEARLLLRAIDYRDTLPFIRLKNTAALHLLTADKLKGVAVPKGAVTAHLGVINSLRRLGALTHNMSQGLEQPVLALQSAREYIDENPDFFIAINTLNQYLDAKGITFRPEEKINIYVNLDE